MIGYQRGGPEALADRPSRPDRVWNRIPEAIRSQIVDLALDQPELSPRELAVRFTDEEKYFVSEASVYRLLKAHDLIASPAYIVIKAAEEFKDKTTAPNQLWQTDFTYLKITGWGWYYLSTVLDDFSRFIVAWKLCATMKAQDVTATLDLALAASGLDQMTVVHRPRLLSDNGASYVAEDLATWLDRQKMEHVRGAPYHPQTQGKIERWHQTLKNRILLEHYYLPGDLERQVAAFVAHYNHARYHESLAISRRPTSTSDEPRPSSSNAKGSSARQSQPSLAASTACRIISIKDDPKPPFWKPAICLKSSDDGHLPFEHSEDIEDQRLAVQLLSERTADDLSTEYARRHLEIVARFGRFPHRNAVLGRTSTPRS